MSFRGVRFTSVVENMLEGKFVGLLFSVFKVRGLVFMGCLLSVERI